MVTPPPRGVTRPIRGNGPARPANVPQAVFAQNLLQNQGSAHKTPESRKLLTPEDGKDGADPVYDSVKRRRASCLLVYDWLELRSGA